MKTLHNPHPVMLKIMNDEPFYFRFPKSIQPSTVYAYTLVHKQIFEIRIGSHDYAIMNTGYGIKNLSPDGFTTDGRNNIVFHYKALYTFEQLPPFESLMYKPEPLYKRIKNEIRHWLWYFFNIEV